MVSDLVLSGLWGFLGGFALVIGAILGFYFKIPPKLVACIMAFGSGVLLSAISFELLDEAYLMGSFVEVAIGFLIGAVIFTLTNLSSKSQQIRASPALQAVLHWKSTAPR